jgi:hypothetical protein
MTLASGTKLGPYEILSPLGASGSFPPLPAGEGWGEGRSELDFGGVTCFSPDAPLTPPSPPDGGRGGWPV